MKKYILADRLFKENVNATGFHAGVKAVQDVHNIALGNGYEPLYIVKYSRKRSLFCKIMNQLFSLGSWLKIALQLKKGDILLIQSPVRQFQLGRDWAQRFLHKKAYIISQIHDVDSLRGPAMMMADTQWEEQMILNYSHMIICHNDHMKQYYRELGVAEDRLVALGIFDYLCEGTAPEEQGEGIVVAGNLDKAKSPYVYMLNDLGIPLELFGPNYSQEPGENVHYNGAVPADVLPNVLRGRFGLVWDGSSADSCAGPTGEYLRYNNPHKTSLYLCAGIPVIIWQEAAISDFITKNQAGIAIDSLNNLQQRITELTDEQYTQMRGNAKKISVCLRTGYYMSKALKEAESKILKSQQGLL